MPRPAAQPPNDDSIQIRLPTQLRARADAIAAAEGRSLAAEIRLLLNRRVAEHDAAQALRGQPGRSTGIGYWDPPETSNSPGVAGAAATTTEAAVTDGQPE